MKRLSEAVRAAVSDLEPDEWVSATLTVTLPLDVSVDSSEEEKAEVLADLHELLLDALPSEFEGCVSQASWEDVAALGGERAA